MDFPRPHMMQSRKGPSLETGIVEKEMGAQNNAGGQQEGQQNTFSQMTDIAFRCHSRTLIDRTCFLSTRILRRGSFSRNF